MSTAPFCFLQLASPLHDPAALRPLLHDYRAALLGLGGLPWETPGEQADLPLALFVATGGTEQEIVKRCEPREPALLVAHPGHNSLPAALEALARLQQICAGGEIIYLQGPQDSSGLSRLRDAVHNLHVRRSLRQARVGLFGAPSDWLVASTPDADSVRKSWGPEILPLSIDLLLRDNTTSASEERGPLFQELCAAKRLEPAEDDILEALRVHRRLRACVEAERLDAVTVRCFDLVTRAKTTGCLALSLLNDEGIAAGCEGDLASLIGLLWVRSLTGRTPWMANPSRIDLDRRVLSLAHCTIARTLTGSYCLRSHFESGLGVALQGEIPAGPVTLVRLGGTTLELLQVREGELLRNTDHPDLCRTQVEIELESGALEQLLQSPLGNHWVLVTGHCAERLRHWHRALIAPGAT